MTTTTETQTEQATAWLKPAQVDELRNATVANSPGYLAPRNDSLIALLYDTGLRVGEAVQLDADLLELDTDDEHLRLPAHLQKDYPNDNTPTYTEIVLGGETARVLRQYLAGAWHSGPALFPSRESDRMTTESVRNVVRNAAHAADVRPHTVDGRGQPVDITPHTLRHSVAYRMLNVENGNTLYDVRNRLRHASIQTTERVYDHFDRV